MPAVESGGWRNLNARAQEEKSVGVYEGTVCLLRKESSYISAKKKN